MTIFTTNKNVFFFLSFFPPWLYKPSTFVFQIQVLNLEEKLVFFKKKNIAQERVFSEQHARLHHLTAGKENTSLVDRLYISE